MRSRSVLVVLSLLAFLSAPAEAAKTSRSARQKKAAAQKRAAAKKKAAAKKGSHAAGSIGATRHKADAAGEQPSTPLRKDAAVASETPAAPKKKVAARSQSRAGTAAQHRPSGVAPVIATSTRPAYDPSAAVAPKKRGGKVRRFFAGIAIVATLSLGAVGWQSADMNGKVSDAWNFIQTQISQVWDGGAAGGGGGGGGPQNPGPLPPHLPGPTDPGPTDPGPTTPSPSGGHGHQTPKGPETDRR